MRHINLTVPSGYRLHVGDDVYTGPCQVTTDVPADTPERMERLTPLPPAATPEQREAAAAAAELARPCTMADLFAAVPAALEQAAPAVQALHAERCAALQPAKAIR